MRTTVDLSLSPQVAADLKSCTIAAATALAIAPERISDLRLLRRSIDARHAPIQVLLQVEATFDEIPSRPAPPPFIYSSIAHQPAVIVVGAGPAGLFAGLKLVELGFRPILIERGHEVSLRKRDIAKIHREQMLDPESNYCFGEGGAGTFSDGKLYTRSKKRGDNRRILECLCFHGAPAEILYEAHPHIGSDKLPKIIAAIRETLLQSGGEIHFGTRVSSLLLHDQTVRGVQCSDGTCYEAQAVILATGHSARDLYEQLHRDGIALEAKGFAMGLRIEHPQALINRIQYHREPGQIPYLPAATYSLVTRIRDRGVYSFCMCPGGFIVPSATEPETIVVNGMSPSLRNSPFANAGLVVELRTEDFGARDPLAGLRLQRALEREAFLHSGGGQTAPAQRVTDFMKQRLSRDLADSSYIPGLCSSPFHAWLPEMIRGRLQEALTIFNHKMPGFISHDGILVGVESRTSSPVRIPRDRESFQHIQIRNLYPCGEGAGYAGGILSSAIDGENCAYAVARANRQR